MKVNVQEGNGLKYKTQASVIKIKPNTAELGREKMSLDMCCVEIVPTNREGKPQHKNRKKRRTPHCFAVGVVN